VSHQTWQYRGDMKIVFDLWSDLQHSCVNLLLQIGFSKQVILQFLKFQNVVCLLSAYRRFKKFEFLDISGNFVIRKLSCFTIHPVYSPNSNRTSGGPCQTIDKFMFHFIIRCYASLIDFIIGHTFNAKPKKVSFTNLTVDANWLKSIYRSKKKEKL